MGRIAGVSSAGYQGGVMHEMIVTQIVLDGTPVTVDVG